MHTGSSDHSSLGIRCVTLVRCRGYVRDFATSFREVLPDVAFGGAEDLIAEGDYVVGQWIGGVRALATP